jgi:penicillin amidase
MRRWKGLANMLGLIALILVVAALGFWLFLNAGQAKTTGSVQVEGLDAEITVHRDAYGVPQIRAASEADAIFAQGFVHAQDRLWQMEMNRRIAAGRLSEVFGEATLDTDKFLRTLGLHRAAAASLEHLDPETLALLEAYAAGVNAFLDSGRFLPPEFRILGLKPEPWRPVDSLGWVKMMSWDLANDWDLELLRLRLVQALGAGPAAELLPSVPEAGETILGRLSLPGLQRSAEGLLAQDAQLRRSLAMRAPELGSNSWVVAGESSESGLPILANDPHLGAQIPGVWYLVGLQGGELDVRGASLPGVPGVIIGRNRHLAWGLTSLNPDVQDLYIEQFDPKRPDQVRFEGAWEPVRVVAEEIGVKDGEPLAWAARATRHGPLISDVLADAPQALALRWTALDPDDRSMQALLALNLAKDAAGLRGALRDFVTPAQNLVYADDQGHIGYIGVGRIPIRKPGPEGEGDGTLPVPGWDGQHEWQGFIPFDELPAVEDPAQGFIVTANNRVVGPDYPYHLSSDWAAPYRAARIRARLEALLAEGPIEPADMRALQLDQESGQALELLDFLKGLLGESPRQTEALQILSGWDGVMAREAAAPAIYQAWLRALPEAILADELHGDLLEAMLQRRHPLFLAEILSGGESSARWCDDILTPEPESCQVTARRALDLALDDLEDRLGGSARSWQWGKLHRTQFDHNPFSQVPLLKPIFHREIENGGDPYTVNVANIDLETPYDQGNLPSYRQVIDLGGQSVFMQPTGQSGHPLSNHYDDLILGHREGAYMLLSLGSEAETKGDMLKLVPRSTP